MRVRVGVAARGEPDGGLDELQEEVVPCPALGAVGLFAGEVGAVDREIDLDGICDAGET